MDFVTGWGKTLLTRVLAVGMLVGMTLLLWAPVGYADGAASDTDVHVAQSLGDRELTVIIRRVGPVLGLLHVDVVSHRGDAPALPAASGPGSGTPPICNPGSA